MEDVNYRQNCTYNLDKRFLVPQEDRKRRLYIFPYMIRIEKRG